MSTRTTEFAAQITGDANGAVAALEKVKVRVQETAKAAETANTKVASSSDLLVKQSEKAAKGVASITQALYAMEAEGSSRVLALGGAVGNFADLLGPGGKVLSGLAIVTASIAALFLQAKEKSAEATKAIEEDIKALVNAGDFATITKRLQEIEQGTAGEGFSDGRSAIRERIAQLTEEANVVGKSARFYRDRQEAIVGEKRRLAELSAEYDRYLKALTDTRNAPSAPRGLSGQPIVSTADSTERVTADSKRAAEAWAKLEKAAADAEEKMSKAAVEAIQQATKALESLNDATGTRLRLTLEQTSAEKSLKQQRELSLSAAADELQAALQGEDAYQRFRQERERAAFIEAELAKAREEAIARGTTLTSAQIVEIKAQAALTFELRDGAAEVASAFGDTGDRISALYEGLALSLSAASGIAAAFGDAGRNAGILLTQTAQLLTNLSKARQVGIFTDKNGKQQNAGFAGALTGAAGAAGVAGAASTAIAVIGGVAQIANALDLFGRDAKARARVLADAAKDFNASLAEFGRSLDDASLNEAQRALSTVADNIGALVAKFYATLGQETPQGFRATEASIRQWIAGLQAEAEKLREEADSDGSGSATLRQRAAGLEAFASALGEIADQAQRAEAVIRERTAAELQRATQDLEVRRLIAAGLTEQADAERLRLEQLEEVREAENRFGTDSPYIDALKAVQAAEAATAASVKRRQAEERRQQVTDDVASRRASLNGNDRDAFVISQTAATRERLDEAKRLFEAGTLTKELFDDLSAVIRDELTASISEFDAAAVAATKRARDEVAVRLLVAEGRDAEAAALRRQLANEEELRDVKDATVRDQIIQAQTLEALAEAAAEALSDALRLREQARAQAGNRINLFDLEGEAAVRETIGGFGKAFELLFKQFDLTTLEGVTAAKEALRAIFTDLDKMSDDDIFAKFGLTRDELISAILDVDSQFDGLASSLKDVATQALEAAQAAADFADSLETDFLRSQGRNKEADIRAVTDRRDERIKTAQQLKLGPGALEQIEAIFKADIAEIESKYAPVIAAPANDPGQSSERAFAASAAGGNSSARRANTSVVSDFGGLSEITAQSLAGLLREVAINTSRDGAIVESILGRGAAASLASLSFPSLPSAAGSGNVMIGNITVTIGSLSPGGLSPVEAAREVTQQITRELGRIASSEARFLGSARRA